MTSHLTNFWDFAKFPKHFYHDRKYISNKTIIAECVHTIRQLDFEEYNQGKFSNRRRRPCYSPKLFLYNPPNAYMKDPWNCAFDPCIYKTAFSNTSRIWTSAFTRLRNTVWTVGSLGKPNEGQWINIFWNVPNKCFEATLATVPHLFLRKINRKMFFARKLYLHRIT